MPQSSHKKAPESRDEQLSRLIKLKRLERPDPDFRRRFEQEFRSKQLSSLVRVQPLHARLYRMCSLASRRAAPPAAAALAVTFVAITNTSYLGHSEMKEATRMAKPSEPAQSADSYPLFVVGAQEQATPESGNANLVPELSSFDAAAIYHVNLIEKPSQPASGYQLMAAPVTFSSPAANEAPALGAKVISTQGDF